MSPHPTGRIRGNDLVLSRRFRASIEDVWTSITDSSSTERWFGRWEGTPGVGNEIRVQMGFEDGQPWLTKKIDACDAPRRLVLTSVGSSFTSRLELSLKTIGDECELEFVQCAIDRARVGEVGPGWEYYLDCLVASRSDGARPTFEAYYPAQKAYFLGL
ncbi:MAG TPA: SRPBCC family protein [Kofleriaceae bacterium]|jgi:uncharacterized protein YndB with AHSA1/START domain|nr:SRPBCC family protein [Kofleriaceae bacterium]